jgi:hypothetical protein
VYIASLRGKYMPAILIADLCEATAEARANWRPLPGETIGIAAVGRGTRTLKGHEFTSMLVHLNGVGQFSVDGDIGGIVRGRRGDEGLFEIEANDFGKVLFVTYPRGWVVRALAKTWTLSPKVGNRGMATLMSDDGSEVPIRVSGPERLGSPLKVLGRFGGWLFRAKPLPPAPAPDEPTEALVLLLISLWFQLAVNDPDPYGSPA